MGESRLVTSAGCRFHRWSELRIHHRARIHHILGIHHRATLAAHTRTRCGVWRIIANVRRRSWREGALEVSLGRRRVNWAVRARMGPAMLLQATALVCLLPSPSLAFVRCRGSSKLKNLWGDALTDPVSCIGPEGQVYPHREVAALAARESRANSGRRGRSLFSSLPSTLDPSVTQQRLLEAYGNARDGGLLSRAKREDTSGCVVGGAPPRLCKSTYNTTAPMYGVSLTSGQPVTIVQKFPDLLQQVIYETCE